MKYCSTRNKEICIDSANAIKNGISNEGGLYVPIEIPKITLEEIEKLSSLKYKDKASYILKKYLTDYSSEEVEDCCEKAYNADKFGSDNTAPLHYLNETESVLELWHGPTCAFKDMALQILPHLLTKAISKTGENNEVVILVATSGDTGKAALEGFKDVPGTKIQVFYPVDGVSKIQKLQMATQDGNNVSVCAVKGNFDDAQTGVKKIFTNNDYKDKLQKKGFSLSSANSINWGRLVPQIVYYFSAYCDLLSDGRISLGDKINIVVPTGNFGNILAAFYAKMMGLPVNKLVCASNSNNVLTDFLSTGIYDRNRSFHTTVSPSMDILISSNLERLLFYLSDFDDCLISGYMNELSKLGKYEVNSSIKSKIKEFFACGYADEEETEKTISDTFKKYGYVIDTHTAVAVSVYNKYKETTDDSTPTVIASTANPFKFNKAVISAIDPDVDFSSKDEFELLDILSEKGSIQIPENLSCLKNKEVRFTAVCDKDDMINQTDAFLNLRG